MSMTHGPWMLNRPGISNPPLNSNVIRHKPLIAFVSLVDALSLGYRMRGSKRRIVSSRGDAFLREVVVEDLRITQGIAKDAPFVELEGSAEVLPRLPAGPLSAE